jgi:hypothetical protein
VGGMKRDKTREKEFLRSSLANSRGGKGLARHTWKSRKSKRQGGDDGGNCTALVHKQQRAHRMPPGKRWKSIQRVFTLAASSNIAHW